MIEAQTYRLGFHNTSDDPRAYADPNELEQARRLDPIERLGRSLTAHGVGDDAREETVCAGIDARLDAAIQAAERLPPPGPAALFDDVYQRPPARLLASAPGRERLRVARLTMVEATRDGLRVAMAADPQVLCLGLDIGRLGGVFRVTKGLQPDFGADRVVDTSLAEGAIIGAAIGLAVSGLRPVAELQFLGFSHQGFHQLGAQLGRFRVRSRGRWWCARPAGAAFAARSSTPTRSRRGSCRCLGSRS